MKDPGQNPSGRTKYFAFLAGPEGDFFLVRSLPSAATGHLRRRMKEKRPKTQSKPPNSTFKVHQKTAIFPAHSAAHRWHRLRLARVPNTDPRARGGPRSAHGPGPLRRARTPIPFCDFIGRLFCIWNAGRGARHQQKKPRPITRSAGFVGASADRRMIPTA